MQNVIKINQDLYWIGANDRKLALFESFYPIPSGVSYNSYFLNDEKTVLFDTVDRAISTQFFENLDYVLGGKNLDYLMVSHMEPDHCSEIKNILLKYPNVKIVCNEKTKTLIEQFFVYPFKDENFVLVNEGDTLNTGRHTFTFAFAPMVHWPEVMMIYDMTEKTLFSADAFGTFGAINGNLFADEVDFENLYMEEARRYYTNIVGKYGTQVQAILKKASNLEIKMICPLHGFVWRKNISQFIDKYILWSTYTPEENGVLIMYASVYGNTQNAAEILSVKLAELGIKNIRMFDVAVTHPSYIIAEAFKYSHWVFASTTYNAGIFVAMENLIHDIVNHNLQKRTVAVIENGSWGVTSGKLITDELAKLKDMNILNSTLSIKSALKSTDEKWLDNLASEIYNSISKNTDKDVSTDNKIDRNALFSISYGLYALSTKLGEKDNACIINTAMQITDKPNQIIISVNKMNFTNDLIYESGKFNLSSLTTETPFSVFEVFGFESGKTSDKFSKFSNVSRSENGVYYLNEFANSYISAEVVSKLDCGTHILYVAKVTEAKKLSDVPSVTYDYYFKHIKPNPNHKLDEKKKGWICKICGYVYEDEILPPDYICPLCKHGADDFKKIK